MPWEALAILPAAQVLLRLIDGPARLHVERERRATLLALIASASAAGKVTTIRDARADGVVLEIEIVVDAGSQESGPEEECLVP